MNDKLLRLKKNSILRNMCVETTFLNDQLIQPIFVSEYLESIKEIPGIPNNFVMNLKESIQQIELDLKNNQKNFLLFMIPKDKKDSDFNFNFQQNVISTIKNTILHKFYMLQEVPGHKQAYLREENILIAIFLLQESVLDIKRTNK